MVFIMILIQHQDKVVHLFIVGIHTKGNKNQNYVIEIPTDIIYWFNCDFDFKIIVLTFDKI